MNLAPLVAIATSGEPAELELRHVLVTREQWAEVLRVSGALRREHEVAGGPAFAGGLLVELGLAELRRRALAREWATTEGTA